MSEYAVMPKADYAEACDTIRKKTGGTESIKSGELPAEIENVYEAGYNDGFVEGEEDGYTAGYTNGWDFGESSGTHDGFDVGIGLEDDTKTVVCFSGYQSESMSGSYDITLDNPTRLIVTVSAECHFDWFEIFDAEGTNQTVLNGTVNAGTYTFDIPDWFVCSAEGGYGVLEIEGSCSDYGIVGVSVTNRMSYAEGYEDRDLEWWRVYQHVDGIGEGWYHYMFAGSRWNKETFKPRYDIKCYATSPGNCVQMFYMHNRNAGEPYDLVEHLAELGVELDLSYFGALFQCFQYAGFSRVGVIDLTGASSSYGLYCVLANSSIETIDKLVLKEYSFDYYGNEFQGADALKNLTIEGVIANNNLNFSACTKLTKASHVSIFEHIHVTKTISITLSKTAVDTAFETSEGVADGSTSAEWLALVASRPNCTISLA